jgi:hypothetical protein
MEMDADINAAINILKRGMYSSPSEKHILLYESFTNVYDSILNE